MAQTQAISLPCQAVTAMEQPVLSTCLPLSLIGGIRLNMMPIEDGIEGLTVQEVTYTKLLHQRREENISGASRISFATFQTI